MATALAANPTPKASGVALRTQLLKRIAQPPHHLGCVSMGWRVAKACLEVCEILWREFGSEYEQGLANVAPRLGEDIVDCDVKFEIFVGV
jgi:hypothetical protein